ncbi:hypothetical protein [Kangiella aquimarina]|uniref:Uncharacterized protein n=1 Tax=Kangiella aquimarina TaxID=261965 RepID=A0ABZ0X425_9GAMM|nr:hypothetical protein [Kangiella aquimarina]WQG85134.1 hypothetical protein SR900_11750 [Kangiella aquimarina]
MMSISLAKRWLQTLAIFHIIGGLLLPIMVYTPLATPYFEHLQAAFTNSNPQSLQFLIGVFGPTVASWGLLFFYAIGKAFESQTRKDWWLLVSAALVWAVLDTAFSIANNVFAHLYLNGGVLILFLLPLFFAKNHFRAKTS